MKTVIIVSKCLRVTKIDPEIGNYEFHFKGVYAGESLKKILLTGSLDFNLKRGEEYLIYLQVQTVENNSLSGKIIKVKRIDECWDKT